MHRLPSINYDFMPLSIFEVGLPVIGHSTIRLVFVIPSSEVVMILDLQELCLKDSKHFNATKFQREILSFTWL